MRINMIMKKTCRFLLVALLIAGLTGCQNKKADTSSVPQAEETVSNEEVKNAEAGKTNSATEEAEGKVTEVKETEATEENTPLESNIKEEKETLRLKDEDLNDSYWRAVYYETFRLGESEEYINEYDDDYYRFMDVDFSNDKTVEFRSIVGDNYESTSGKGEWRITEMGDVILENITPFEGMNYGYGFIPRFSLVDSKYAPNHEEGMIALEYMEGCVYFKKMEKTDPYEGVDLANSDRLKQAMERSRMNGQDITGEWILLSCVADDGNKWYALESGVESILYIGDNYANFQYVDSTGHREEYYGMHMTYDDMALYTDISSDYSIYFQPYPSEYEDRYEYVNFGMAPDGEHLIVQMNVCEIGQEYPTTSYLTFQRGFG